MIAHHASVGARFEVVGFFDDFVTDEARAGGRILGPIRDCESKFRRGAFDCFLLGIGYLNRRLRSSLFSELAATVPAATLVHPSCYVDPSAQIAPGSVILPGCTIDKGVVIEENVLLNVGCTIAHDTRVQRNSFLAPRVALAGFVEIGADCFLGINSTVIDRVTVCQGVRTGGGAVLVDNISEAGLYVGIPARRRR